MIQSEGKARGRVEAPSFALIPQAFTPDRAGTIKSQSQSEIECKHPTTPCVQSPACPQRTLKPRQTHSFASRSIRTTPTSQPETESESGQDDAKATIKSQKSGLQIDRTRYNNTTTQTPKETPNANTTANTPLKRSSKGLQVYVRQPHVAIHRESYHSVYI